MRFKLIPLTQGLTAKVSPEDYARLSRWKWQAHWFKRSFYATRSFTISPKKRITILMHREVLGLIRGDKRLGDHRNQDTLDNRRGNLRTATSSQNVQNSCTRCDSSTGLRGVDFHRPTKKWQARVQLHGTRIYLGVFSNKREAIFAYRKAARELHGEFARFS